jgi:hypothetical protein
MLNLSECKKILNADKRKYTDEEVKQIRDYVYFVAKLQVKMEQLNTSKDE